MVKRIAVGKRYVVTAPLAFKGWCGCRTDIAVGEVIKVIGWRDDDEHVVVITAPQRDFYSIHTGKLRTMVDGL